MKKIFRCHLLKRDVNPLLYWHRRKRWLPKVFLFRCTYQVLIAKTQLMMQLNIFELLQIKLTSL